MSSYRQGRMDEENSALLLQHVADADAHQGVIITVALNIINNNATEGPQYMDLDTQNDYVYTSFWCDADVVDTSQDVVLTWIWMSDNNNATFDIDRYLSAIKTDGSEAHSWNIWSASSTTENVTSGQPIQTVYTVTAANVDADDIIEALFRNKEAADDAHILGCFATYTKL